MTWEAWGSDRTDPLSVGCGPTGGKTSRFRSSTDFAQCDDLPSSRLHQPSVTSGYGMTEAGPVISMCLAFAKEPFEIKSGSCGTVVRNAELKLVDPDTGASLPRNQAGEICIRGNQIMKGYLNDLEATATTIDKDGWLHTGDIGYVDDDDELLTNLRT
ncbi:hypothetical protein EJ110_NYTH12021 [Nymphaea thermarum]|nr:hypothetical protein EJ110_NYTH12021 [Nymphaea thermarum]